MLIQADIEFLMQGLPFWNKLSQQHKQLILDKTSLCIYEKNTKQYHSAGECAGLVILKSGQLRAFMISEDGKEISLYRLLPMDICIMSAACMLKNLNFEINLEVEKDSELLIVPTSVIETIHESNAAVKDYILDLVSSRFSNVMWVLEQLVFSNMGKRLAMVLLEQSVLADGPVLEITHDNIAKDLGTAREVVTRLLKQFQLDNIVMLLRSKIKILDIDRLRQYAK